MKTFRNANYTRRNYETTNVVECEAPSIREARLAMPGINWVERPGIPSANLTALYRIGNVRVYGYL